MELRSETFKPHDERLLRRALLMVSNLLERKVRIVGHMSLRSFRQVLLVLEAGHH